MNKKVFEKSIKNKSFVKQAKPEENETNKYYLNISLRAKILKIALIIFLVMFIFAGLATHPEEITVENIKYLFKYMDILPAQSEMKPEFNIETDENFSVCRYKNNIAVLNRGRLDIYDYTGRKNFTHRLAYSNPVLCASEKYILTYDLGSNKLDIFNSVSQIYEYKGGEALYGAKITDRGYVAYITKEAGYSSAIKILRTNFTEMREFAYVKERMVDIDIDDSAQYLAAAGFRAEDGDYLTRVLLYKGADAVCDIEISGEMPYQIKLNDSGFCVLLENSVRFYNLSGEKLGEYNFSRRSVIMAELGERFSAVVLSEKTLGSDERIIIFDNSGSVICEQIINAEIADIKFCENYNFLYFLTRTGLYRVDTADKIYELTASQKDENSENIYDETTKNIIYADDKNIILAGLLKINILEK